MIYISLWESFSGGKWIVIRNGVFFPDIKDIINLRKRLLSVKCRFYYESQMKNLHHKLSPHHLLPNNEGRKSQVNFKIKSFIQVYVRTKERRKEWISGKVLFSKNRLNIFMRDCWSVMEEMKNKNFTFSIWKTKLMNIFRIALYLQCLWV